MISRTCIFLALAIVQIHAANEVIEWTGGQFEFSSPETKAVYQSSGRYIPKNIIATRAQIWKDDIYVALPRYKPGVPVTLAKIGVKSKGVEPVLTPFPSWSSQDESDCNSLQSVVDIFIDDQGILWALDVGVVNTLESPIRKSVAKVLAFNLATGKKVKTLDLSGLVAQASRLQYVVVEYAPDGKPFAYISDAATRSILVFDIADNKGYRVVLPKAISGNRRDVLYINLVRKGCGHNFLVFTYLSGNRSFTIKTDYLRAGCAAGKIQDMGSKGGKAVFLGTDGGSALFFRYEGKPEVYRWDSNKSAFTDFELVYKSPECYLATQVLPDMRRVRMRVLESNFPDFIQGTVGCGASQRVALMVSEVPK